MNILHIWDQSGVACIIAKYQRKLGHNVKVLRRSDYDPYGIYSFYKELVEFSNERDFFETCLKNSFSADIVHIHSRTDVLLYLYRKMHNKPRFVMHFHGSDLRGLKRKQKKWPISNFLWSTFRNYRQNALREKNNGLAEELAHKILISTPDLINYVKKREPVILLHNPIDIDHFCQVQNHKPAINTFFTFATEATSDKKWISNFCKEKGINNLNIYDRTQNPIMYSDMPDFIRNHEVYVDIRYINNRVVKNLSKTALESLACGLKVIDHNLKYIHGLPAKHNPMNVVDNLNKIYKEIL